MTLKEHSMKKYFEMNPLKAEGVVGEQRVRGKLDPKSMEEWAIPVPYRTKQDSLTYSMLLEVISGSKN